MALRGLSARRENAHQVETRIREKLKAATRNTGSHRAFIRTDDIKTIWNSLDVIETVLSGTSEWSREELETVQKDYILTLTILFKINWLEGHDFKATFFQIEADGVTRNDEAIHYRVNDLAFLQGYQDNFFETQFRFKPAVLRGSDNQIVDAAVPLPFIEESEPLGSGGFGNVYKVKVAPGHFETEHGNVNKEESVFAIKRFPQTHQSEEDFKKEVNNVELLKESLSTPRRVMLHIATIIHGNELAILMPIADRWDLETFLYKGFNRDNGTKKAKEVYNFQKMFPDFVGSYRHASVLYEMYALAHALDWLHNQLALKGRPGIRCAHTDFKPSNVLICWDKDKGKEYPAGKWMITDFGISAFGSGAGENEEIEDSRSNHETTSDPKTIYDFGVHLTSKNDTIRVARTQEGTYQPPESRHSGSTHFVGRRSDIWSFGCVLLEVIIFALGDVELLDRFRNQRAHGHKLDCFYSVNEVYQGDIHGRRRSEQTLEVKREVLQWLNWLPQEYQSELAWLQTCKDLIVSTLEIKPHDRPGAQRLRLTLQKVSDRTESETTKIASPSTEQLPEPTAALVQSPNTPQLSTPEETIVEPVARLTQSPMLESSQIESAQDHENSKFGKVQTTSTFSISRAPEHTANHHRGSFNTSDQSISTHTRRSTSAPSGWTSSDTDSLSRSHTTEANSSPLEGLTRRLSLGSPVRQCPIPKREKVVDACLAPNAEQAAFLSPNRIKVFPVADGSPCANLDLDQRDWRQIAFSGDCIAVYGLKGTQKQVFLYDLQASQCVSVPIDVGLNDVWKTIVSSQRLFGLVSRKAVSIMDIFASKTISCPIDKELRIEDAKFSGDGKQLFVWARGPNSDTPNRCYFWSFPHSSTEKGAPGSSFEMYKTAGISTPEISLIPSSSGHFCVAQENNDRFFIVQPSSSSSRCPRDLSTIVIKDVLKACVYGNESMICLLRPKRAFFGREHAQIREHRVVVESNGSHRIMSESKEFASLEADHLNDISSMVALPEEEACVLCFLNGRIEIVKRTGLNGSS